MNRRRWKLYSTEQESDDAELPKRYVVSNHRDDYVGADNSGTEARKFSPLGGRSGKGFSFGRRRSTNNLAKKRLQAPAV